VTHVALVTGSSRGLGAVIAQRLARDGFAVAVNGRPGDEQVAAIGRAIRDGGGAAEGFCADVTDEDQVAGLATRSLTASAQSMCWSSTPPARNPKPR
jgi:3-oxoacyl-[acyl-carrier protein] reductase